MIAWRRERWDTPDGDFIDVDRAGDTSTARTLALFHGLEGSSSSPYARSIAEAALARGWRVALAHFRGCSGEPNRLPRAYHSGDSTEIDWILRRLAGEAGGAVFAAGISLGGNALLKWLGERDAAAGEIVHRAAAVSAPLDLAAAGASLDRGFNRQVYTRHFLATMIPRALAKLDRFPGLYPGARVASARSFRVFDDTVTAPLHGFLDVDDYWARASSAPWLATIRVPTLVLNAKNDPFLPHVALEAATCKASPDVLLEFPDTGGHAGFLEGPFPGHHGWLARRLTDFLANP